MFQILGKVTLKLDYNLVLKSVNFETEFQQEINYKAHKL